MHKYMNEQVVYLTNHHRLGKIKTIHEYPHLETSVYGIQCGSDFIHEFEENLTIALPSKKTETQEKELTKEKTK